MATNDKYDRQLRLWGSSGQKALSSTLAVLIGSSACGTESLKNLVLPGVGAFLVLDDVVYDADAVVVDEIGDDRDGDYNAGDCFGFDTSANTANFFAGSSSCGAATKAALARRLLCELNPDARGFHRTVPSLERLDCVSLLKGLLEQPLKTTDGSSSSSSAPSNILVITADQPSSVVLPVSKACHSLNLPLVNVRSYGLLGYVRIQTPSPHHVVRDAKKTNRPPDLRLADGYAFDELKRVVESVDSLDDMEDSKMHGHVPFVIILVQALRKWKESRNDDRSPETYDEKEEFRSLIKSMARDYDNQLNFREAYDHAHLAWAKCALSDESREVLDECGDEKELYRMAIDADMNIASSDNDGSSLSGNNRNGAVLQFRLMACALRRFLKENDDVPPLEGTIPDMACDTKTFVALQEAYRARAEADRREMTRHIVDLLEECKAKSNGCKLLATMPSEEDIVTFCKNSRDIRVLETRPLFMEYRAQDPASPVVASLGASVFDASSSATSVLPNFDSLQADAREDLVCSTMDPYDTDPMQTPLLWFIALRACDAFFDRHGHYPGKHDQALALEADANEIFKLIDEVVGHMGLRECDFIKETLLDEEKGKNVAREVVRYDEAEVHTIAAVMGGVASQEAVKLITGQYIPVNDTYVYNGIASTAGVYRF